MVDEKQQDERLSRSLQELSDLLVSILGNTGLVLLDLPEDSPLRTTTRRIETAAKRAAELTDEMSNLLDEGDEVEEGRLTPVEPLATPRENGDEPSQSTVLLVDDDDLVRRTVSLLLENLGYKAILAEDGHQAIAAYRRFGNDIDAVILDLVMPGMDGADVLRALRELDPGVRILLSYGGKQRGAIHVLRSSEVMGSLEKPYSPEQLKRALEYAIAGKRGRDAK